MCQGGWVLYLWLVVIIYPFLQYSEVELWVLWFVGLYTALVFFVVHSPLLARSWTTSHSEAALVHDKMGEGGRFGM